MHVILILIALVLFVFYLIRVRDQTIANIVNSINEKIYYIWRFAKNRVSILLERKQVYCIYQNLTPYIETIREMRVAKYIRFANSYLINQDVEAFRFEIYGINSDYKKDSNVLKQLLIVKLRDFYIEKLGDFAPCVYLTHLQEGEFVVWVARNRHGDKVILERMESDRKRECPDTQDKLWDVVEKNILTLGWDLEVYEEFGLKKSIILDIRKKPSGLVTGASGSGKSYFITILLNHILQVYGDSVVVYYCDFKSSEDTEYLSQYCRYFTGEKCADGLVAYYEEYQAVKDGKRDGKLRLIFFDEWAGFQLWETQKSKKQAEVYKGMLQEILLMGRSLLCGAWVILQRPDSSWLSGRENFHSICCFLSGGVSSELGRMISLEEEITDKIKQRDFFQIGEAVYKSDGEKSKFMKVGEIPDISVYQQQILAALLRTDGEAGSTESATPPF